MTAHHLQSLISKSTNNVSTASKLVATGRNSNSPTTARACLLQPPVLVISFSTRLKVPSHTSARGNKVVLIAVHLERRQRKRLQDKATSASRPTVNTWLAVLENRMVLWSGISARSRTVTKLRALLRNYRHHLMLMVGLRLSGTIHGLT